jgi:hypothetical protein
MNDPDLERIGSTLARVAHARARSRRGARRRAGALAGAITIAAAALVVGQGLNHGSESVATAAQGGFTEYAIIHRGGRAETGGCAVATCDQIDQALEREIIGAQLLTTVAGTRSARLVNDAGRVLEIGQATRKAGSTTFSFATPSARVAAIQLLDASGRVLQTLRT